MNKNIIFNAVLLIGISLALTCVIYVFDIWMLSSRFYISPTEATFIEGILLVLLGALLFIGSGGLSSMSQREAVLASAAKAIYNKDVVGPSDIFRRETWKPKGYVRLGLILMIAGIFLLIIYSVSL